MATSFSLTAKLNIVGPSNLGAVAAQIQRGLNPGLNSKVKVTIDQASFQSAKTSIGGLNSNLSESVQKAKDLQSAMNGIKAPKITVPTIRQTTSSLKQAGTAAKSFKKDIDGASHGLSNFTKEALVVAKRSAAFALTTSVIFGSIRLLSYGVSEAAAFEKEMVKIGQVSGRSLKSLRGFGDEIGRISQEYGASSKELADVAQTLIQAGFSVKEAQQTLETVAKSSLAPSFNDTKNTVEALIAIMGQFKNVNVGNVAEIKTKINVGDLEKVLGSINKLSADLAVEADDITAAVRRAGSVFSAIPDQADSATDSLFKFNSIFSIVRQNTRESAETVATGLRTIFTRIQRPRTIEFLRQFNVELQDARGNFIGGYEAIKKISELFNTLPSNSGRAAAIAEELAGIRQINKFLPLVTDFASIELAFEKAKGGTGSLDEQKIAAQKSLANQIDRTRESFLKLSRDIYNSNIFQFLATTLIRSTDAAIRFADSMKELLPIILTFATIKAIPVFSSIATGAKNFLFPASPSKKANGGKVLGFNTGGLVPGQGSGDTVPAMLEAGEYVIRKDAVRAIGVNNLERANYAKGGRVDRQKKLGFLPDMFNFYGRIFGGDVAKAMQGIKKPRFYNKMKSQTSGNDIFGRYRPETQQIGILNSLKGRDVKSTAAHEYFHAYTDTFQDLSLLKTMSAFGSKNPMMKITDEAKRHADFKGFDGDMRKYFLEPQEIAARSFEQLAYPHYKHMTVPKRERYDEMNKLMMAARHERKMYMENDEDPERQFLNMIFGGKKFAKGGSSKDRVRALLTPGEYVINKEAAGRIGKSRLDKWNKADKLGGQVLGFNKGGQVPGSPIRMSEGGGLDINTAIQGDLDKIAKRFGLDIVKSAKIVVESFSNPVSKGLKDVASKTKLKNTTSGAYDSSSKVIYINSDDVVGVNGQKTNINTNQSRRLQTVSHEIFHYLSDLAGNLKLSGDEYEKILKELKDTANSEVANGLKGKSKQEVAALSGKAKYHTRTDEVAARAFASTFTTGTVNPAVAAVLQKLNLNKSTTEQEAQSPSNAIKKSKQHAQSNKTKPKTKAEKIQKPVITAINEQEIEDSNDTLRNINYHTKFNRLQQEEADRYDSSKSGYINKQKSYERNYLGAGYSEKEARTRSIEQVKRDIQSNKDKKSGTFHTGYGQKLTYAQAENVSVLRNARNEENKKKGVRGFVGRLFNGGGGGPPNSPPIRGGGGPPNDPPNDNNNNNSPRKRVGIKRMSSKPQTQPQQQSGGGFSNIDRAQVALFLASSTIAVAAENRRVNAKTATEATGAGGLSGAAAGAGLGLSAGLSFGPYGAVIGAVAGGAIGAIDGMNSSLQDFIKEGSLKNMTAANNAAATALEKLTDKTLSMADRLKAKDDFLAKNKEANEEALKAAKAEVDKENGSIVNYVTGGRGSEDLFNNLSVGDIPGSPAFLFNLLAKGKNFVTGSKNSTRVEDYLGEDILSGLNSYASTVTFGNINKPFSTSAEQAKNRKEAEERRKLEDDPRLKDTALAQSGASIQNVKKGIEIEAARRRKIALDLTKFGSSSDLKEGEQATGLAFFRDEKAKYYNPTNNPNKAYYTEEFGTRQTITSQAEFEDKIGREYDRQTAGFDSAGLDPDFVLNVKKAKDARIAKQLKEDIGKTPEQIEEAEQDKRRKELRNKDKEEFIKGQVNQEKTAQLRLAIEQSSKSIVVFSLRMREMQDALESSSEALGIQQAKLQDFTRLLSGDYSAGQFKSKNISQTSSTKDVNDVYNTLGNRAKIDLSSQRDSASSIQNFDRDLRANIEKYAGQSDENPEELRTKIIRELGANTQYKGVDKKVIEEFANEFIQAKEGNKEFDSIPGSLGTLNELKEAYEKQRKIIEENVNRTREVYNARLEMEKQSTAKIFELSQVKVQYEQERLEKEGKLFDSIPQFLTKDLKLASISGGETNIDRISREAQAKQTRLLAIKDDPTKENEFLILTGELNKLRGALEYAAANTDRLSKINERLSKVDEIKNRQSNINDKFLGSGLKGRIDLIRGGQLFNRFKSGDDRTKNAVLSSAESYNLIKQFIEFAKQQNPEDGKKLEDRFLKDASEFSPTAKGFKKALDEEKTLKQLQQDAQNAQIKASESLSTLVSEGAGAGIKESNRLLNEIKGVLQGISSKTIARATGGLVGGTGTSTSDNLHTFLSPQEFVMNAGAVKGAGVKTLNYINKHGKLPKFADGGEVKNSSYRDELKYFLHSIDGGPVSSIDSIGEGLLNTSETITGREMFTPDGKIFGGKKKNVFSDRNIYDDAPRTAINDTLGFFGLRKGSPSVLEEQRDLIAQQSKDAAEEIRKQKVDDDNKKAIYSKKYGSDDVNVQAKAIAEERYKAMKNAYNTPAYKKKMEEQAAASKARREAELDKHMSKYYVNGKKSPGFVSEETGRFFDDFHSLDLEEEVPKGGYLAQIQKKEREKLQALTTENVIRKENSNGNKTENESVDAFIERMKKTYENVEAAKSPKDVFDDKKTVVKNKFAGSVMTGGSLGPKKTSTKEYDEYFKAKASGTSPDSPFGNNSKKEMYQQMLYSRREAYKAKIAGNAARYKARTTKTNRPAVEDVNPVQVVNPAVQAPLSPRNIQQNQTDILVRQKLAEERARSEQFEDDVARVKAAEGIRLNTGGPVIGKGGSRTDSVPAMLSNGEFVINAAAAKKYGYNNLHGINNIAYAANGGQVGNNLPKSPQGRNSISLDPNVNTFVTALNSFKQDMSKIAEQLDGLTISMEGKHEVNVVINGAEVLNTLLNGPLKDLVSSEIQKAITKNLPLEQRIEK